MINLNTNLSSQIVQQSMSNATKLLNLSVEQMTTGYKLNHAKDNAANYSISTNLTTKIGAYQVAEENICKSLDMVNTAAETLTEMNDLATRLRALAIQGRNGTYGDKSLDALNSEAIALLQELYRTKNSAEYNGISLFGGTEQSGEITFPDGTTQTTRGFIVEVNKRDTSKMQSVESLDETQTYASGSFSISTPEELEKMVRLRKNNITGTACEFVLANNIDMEEWCKAHEADGGWDNGNMYDIKFDGNGYVIANVSSTKTRSFLGVHASISNLGLENINIDIRHLSNAEADGATAFCSGSYGMVVLNNCYATGSIKGRNIVGGLVSSFRNGSIKNCYSDVEVYSVGHEVGGVVGALDAWGNQTVENCYSLGDVRGTTSVGGLIGRITAAGNTTKTIKNCCSTSDVKAISDGAKAGGLIGDITINAGSVNAENCYSVGSVISEKGVAGGAIGASSVEISGIYYNTEISGQSDTGNGVGLTSAELNKMVALGQLPDFGLELPGTEFFEDNNMFYSPALVGFQVGISGNDSGGINIDLTFKIEGLKELSMLGLYSDKSIDQIDKVIASIQAKASEYGALQNRLESALEEVSIKYENLVSSRSTIKDADISEVSSTYIQQQILQQASATLLATANQTPSIALGLI